MKLESMLALVLSFVGALAWLPFIFDKLQFHKINGRIIGHQIIHGIYKEKDATILLFKIGIMSNKPYSYRDIELTVEYEHLGNVIYNVVSIRNLKMKEHGNSICTLNLSSDEYLNNHVFIPKQKAISGYIIGVHSPIIKEKIINVKVSFISFNDESKSFSYSFIGDVSDKQVYEDSIWDCSKEYYS